MQGITLRDGRRLTFTFFGDAQNSGSGGSTSDGVSKGAVGGSGVGSGSDGAAGGSRTLLYFHGFPSSRLEGGLLHKDALYHGIRVLAVDRPGAGGSSFNPKQTVESTVEDMRELLDHLQLKSIVVMGASGGSPFASACAALLPPERVEALLLVCPLMPTCGREEQLLPGTSANTLRLFTGIRQHPWRVWATLHLLRLIQMVPHGNLLLKVGGFSEEDKRVMVECPDMAAIEKEAVREGLAQGVAGAFRDLQTYYVDPPTIDLASIQCKTEVWQGDKDTTTPMGMAKHYAATIPRATLHLLEGEGHLSLPFRHNRKILSSIVEHAARL